MAESALSMLAAALLVPAFVVCLYYLFLAAVACWPRGQTRMPRSLAQTRFAILIPAHDEEAQIADVLASCAAFAYPADRFQVFVVADNCTDQTAALASEMGAICLERHDRERRGKGPALAWALERLLPQRPDAVVVLDADCRLDRHALRTFDACLQAGYPVLQASYVASNPDQSMVSYVSAVANAIENDLFYAPKSRLGLAVLLRGTGMVFRRDVLERCPWRAASVVEDVEYTIRLYEAGIPVQFVPEVRVWSAFPTQAEQMRIQRTRWVGGNARLALKQAGPLALRGLRTGKLGLLDLAWTLLVSLRSLAALLFLLAALVSMATAILTPKGFAATLGKLGIALLGLAVLYFGIGILHFGLNGQRWRRLVQVPGTVARLLGVAVASLRPGQVRFWERTPR